MHVSGCNYGERRIKPKVDLGAPWNFSTNVIREDGSLHNTPLKASEAGGAETHGAHRSMWRSNETQQRPAEQSTGKAGAQLAFSGPEIQQILKGVYVSRIPVTRERIIFLLKLKFSQIQTKYLTCLSSEWWQNQNKFWRKKNMKMLVLWFFFIGEGYLVTKQMEILINGNFLTLTAVQQGMASRDWACALAWNHGTALPTNHHYSCRRAVDYLGTTWEYMQPACGQHPNTMLG